MKNIIKFSCLVMACFLLTGCNDNDIDRLEHQVENLEDKIDALLNQNGNYNNNNTGSSNDNVINNGEGETTVDTATIETTINGFETDANALANNINGLSIPTNRTDAIDLYWEYKIQLENLETSIDRYEDELERMYRTNSLSYNDFRTYDRQLEDIENTLDRAEDDLEYITRYDD